jgi:hypothetical protein
LTPLKISTSRDLFEKENHETDCLCAICFMLFDEELVDNDIFFLLSSTF